MGRIPLCVPVGLMVQSPPHMSKIVGIDLGTTNSLVATVDSGIPLVIADAAGRRLTPSVVHFSSATAMCAS
ncbi:MAG: Hsp70 family protein [Limisphaerales bacterium]